MGLTGLDDWHLLCLKNGASCSVMHYLYVDLKRDLEKIKGIISKYNPDFIYLEPSNNDIIENKG